MWGPFGPSLQTMYSLPALKPSTGFIDLKLPAGLMVAGINPSEVDIRVAGNVVEWRTRFWPSQEGLFRVVGDEVPSDVDEFDAACGLNNLDSLLTTDLHGEADVAVVMVHGWQTLGQILQGGDNDKNQVLCTGWIDIMSMFQHASEGHWPALREAADLFTFRYNSDYRIVRSGEKLATAIEALHDEGYANVILLAHSMGGLVSVEARQRLDHPEYLKGIVTLGTPFMGGIVDCVSTLTLSFPEAPEEQPYCVMLRTADYLVSPILDFIVPAGGSFDLTQYKGLDGLLNTFGSEDNPYLQRLWEGPDNPNFENIHAIYGDSNLPSMSARFNMKLSISVARITYGHSDGAVPTGSAIASKERKRSADDAQPYSELATVVPVGRDHGQLLNGCTRCADGRHGDKSAYDPYFDEVAAGLWHFLSDKEPVDGGTLLWELPVDSPEDTWFMDSPAFADDGTIYFRSSNHLLIAVSPDGEVLWDYAIRECLCGGWSDGSPVVADDGTIYVTATNELHAVSPNGKRLWVFPFDSSGSGDYQPVLDGNGSLYLAPRGSNAFYKFNNAGVPWQFPDTEELSFYSGSHAVQGNTVYAACEHSYLCSFDLAGGFEWKTPTGYLTPGLAIQADGTVYAVSASGTPRLTALTPDGSEAWSVNLPTGTRGSMAFPVIGENGVIYLGTQLGLLHAFTPAGDQLWTADFGARNAIHSLVGSDGVVYATSNRSASPYVHSPIGIVAAVDFGGEVIWSDETSGTQYGAPGLSNEGVLYVGGYGRVFAYATSADGIANSPWPTFQQNNRRTGRAP